MLDSVVGGLLVHAQYVFTYSLQDICNPDIQPFIELHIISYQVPHFSYKSFVQVVVVLLHFFIELV